MNIAKIVIIIIIMYKIKIKIQIYNQSSVLAQRHRREILDHADKRGRDDQQRLVRLLLLVDGEQDGAKERVRLEVVDKVVRQLAAGLGVAERDEEEVKSVRRMNTEGIISTPEKTY